MKKLVSMLAVIIAMGAKMSIAQVEVSTSGSVMYSSKNASVGTGMIFSEDPAVICQLNASLSYGKLGVFASYSGYTGIQRFNIGDQKHLFDVFGSYEFCDGLTVYVGPEFVYNDSEVDVTSAGLVAMMTWSKGRISSTLIYYTNPQFTFHYVIGSMNVEISSNFSAYVLGGYTTAEDTPVYGVAGLKYTKNAFYVGAYYAIRSNAPGPFFNIGFAF